MTFARGDIVRLRSDEQEAERCEGESSREYHRARRYIVLGVEEPALAFRIADDVVRRPAMYDVWPITSAPFVVSLVVYEGNLIATGERAEEIA